MNEFHYVSYAQEVIFAPGALARLQAAVERFGWKRIMLCASHSMRAGGQVRQVESVFQESLVAVFDRVQPRVLDLQVQDAVALAREKRADAILGLGGGSPIGMATAIGFQLQI